jgi:hypothetical protein
VKALLWAAPAALALFGAYRVAPAAHRDTIRLAAATALWVTLICLLITWS